MTAGQLQLSFLEKRFGKQENDNKTVTFLLSRNKRESNVCNSEIDMKLDSVSEDKNKKKWRMKSFLLLSLQDRMDRQINDDHRAVRFDCNR